MSRDQRHSKRELSTSAQVLGKRTRSREREEAVEQIAASGLGTFCSVNFREQDLRGSGGFELVFCHTKLGQGVVMLHSVRQDAKSHRDLSKYGRCCRTKA